MTTNLRAAAFITRNATDPAEARLFLQMLGLVDDAGRITPDETRSLPLEVPLAAVAQREPTSVQWWTDKPEVSTAPEALRNLPPVVQQPAVRAVKPRVRAPQPRNLAPCGTESAAKRHVRYKEPLCDKCQVGREQRKAQQVDGTTHGTKAGYQWHYRHKERPCSTCAEAFNAWRRERRAKKGAPTLDKRCGTERGYDAHGTRGEAACDPCKAAERARSTKRRGFAKCGTEAGHALHRRRGELPCRACKDAKNETQAKRRKSRAKVAA